MRNKRVQAKHVCAAAVLVVVGLLCETRGHPACTWRIQDEFPQFPRKVVMAKLCSLVKRGMLEGCTCGCRGDFELTDKGREALA